MSYEKSSLEAQTVAALRDIAKKEGIPGMSKKRKDIIIDAILSKTTSAKTNKSSPPANGLTAQVQNMATNGPVTSAEFTMTSTLTHPSKQSGDRCTTAIQVSSGASSGKFPVVGKSVGAVMEFLREVLNVDRLAEGTVNGKKVSNTYILQDSDTLEFIKPAGRKG